MQRLCNLLKLFDSPTGKPKKIRTKAQCMQAPLLHARVVFPRPQAPTGLVSCPRCLHRPVIGCSWCVQLPSSFGPGDHALVGHNMVRILCTLTMNLLFLKGHVISAVCASGYRGNWWIWPALRGLQISRQFSQQLWLGCSELQTFAVAESIEPAEWNVNRWLLFVSYLWCFSVLWILGQFVSAPNHVNTSVHYSCIYLHFYCVAMFH